MGGAADARTDADASRMGKSLFDPKRCPDDELSDTPLYFGILERVFGLFRFFSIPPIAVGIPLGVVAKFRHGTQPLWCPSLCQYRNRVCCSGRRMTGLTKY